MSKFKVFRSVEFGDIRCIVINGIPYFVAMDVATRLGYTNTHAAVSKHVDEEDKLVLQNNQNVSFVEETFHIPTRGLLCVTEGGLYSLILRSKLPAAKKFTKWVTNIILPTLRKEGEYKIEPSIITYNTKGTEDDETLILARANQIMEKIISEKTNLLIQQKDIIEEKQNLIVEKEKIITEQSKVLGEKEMFINQVAKSTNSIKVRSLAQLCCKNGINIGQNRLFEKLRTWGMLCRSDNSPYQRYLDMGLFEVVEFPIETAKGIEIKRSLRITGKGQEYIVVKLIKEMMQESPVM